MENTQEHKSKKQPSNIFSRFLRKLNFISKRNNSTQQIAVIRMHGVISSSGSLGQSNVISYKEIENLLTKTEKIKKLAALVILVNSPGGSPVQSELIYRKLKRFAKSKNIDIYCFIEDLGASGGYFISCAAKEIYALPSSIVGSIGVISAGFGFVEAIKKLGIERRIYTQGENKSILDPFKPEKEEDINLVKKVQKDIHDHFIEIVKESRSVKLKENEQDIFSGKFWSGKEAVNIGLIDGIDDYDNFVKEKFGHNVKYIFINTPTSWLKRKFGMLFDSLISTCLNRLKLEDLQQRFK